MLNHPLLIIMLITKTNNQLTKKSSNSTFPYADWDGAGGGGGRGTVD